MKSRTSILILVLSGFILYFNSLFNGFLGDDFDQIVNNKQIQSIWNIPSFFSGSTYFRQETGNSFGFYYRPVMQSVYSIIYSFAGADPLFFHLVSILLHISIVVLYYLLIFNYSSSRKAFFLSLIFLIHPINSEAVLYIANLQDLLFVLFGLISFHLLKRKDNRFSDLSAVFLSLSLFSKETGIIFVLLSILYTALFKRKNKYKYYSSFIFTTLVYLFFRSVIAGESFSIQRYTPMGTAPLPVRLVNIPYVISKFIQTLIFPLHLEINQMRLITDVFSREFILSLIISIVFLLLIFRNIRKGKIQALFVFWIVSSLILHIHLVPLDSTYSDRWFYIAVMGILGLVGVNKWPKYLAGRFLDSRVKRGSLGMTVKLFVLFLILILSARTFIRTFDYRDAETLYKHDLKYSKGNYYLENSLAAVNIQDGKYNEAKPLVESSIRKFIYFGNLNNMAMIYANDGDFKSAEVYFQKAINEGGDYTVYKNYANFLIFLKKDNSEAVNFLKKTINNYPQSREMFILLSLADYWSGNKKEALEIINGILNFQKDEKMENLKKIMTDGGNIDYDKVKWVIGYQ